ncbi:MAG: PRC-barrel domain-containing protein [Phycisphaerales bacterium]
MSIRFSTSPRVISLFAAITFAWSVPCLAHQTSEPPKERDNPPSPTTIRPSTPEPPRAQSSDRAVLLIPGEWTSGKDVYGIDDKKIGDVKDILIGSDTGFAEYLVVSRGGVLGVAATNIAVPVMAFDWNDARKMLVLPVSKEEFKNAPELKENDWKYLLSDSTRNNLRTYYHIDVSRRRWEDGKRVPSDKRDAVLRDWSLIRYSDIKGQKLMSDAAAELGTIKDVVFDVPSGRVAFVLVSEGGTLGVGSKRVLIPWDSMSVNDEGKVYAIKISPDTLKAAPSVDMNDWSELRRAGYARSIYQHYGKDATWLDTTSNKTVQRNREYDDLYRRGQATEVSGTVVRIEEARPVASIPDHRAITIRMDDGTQKQVCLAPASVLKERGLDLAAGDRVTVVGREVKHDGRVWIMASRVTGPKGQQVMVYMPEATP